MDTLSLSIHAELQIGSLLGGEINWPLGCDLIMCRDYYLIQADLVRGGQGGLDILQLLNSAFGCSLPEGYIKVDKAGFFTYGERQELSERKKLKEIFPVSTLPESIASSVAPMENTMAFWLVANLHAIKILDHLVEIGVARQENQLALYALLNNTKNAANNFSEVMLSASLPDITLLRLFSFKKLYLFLQLSSGKHRAFQLEGNLCVSLFGEPYLFHGRLTSDGHMLRAEITSSHQINEPFGGKMRGMQFGKLAFCLAYIYQEAIETGNRDTTLKPGESLIWLNASVSYANLTLSGKLYLYDKEPVLAVVALEKDFAISTFFKRSLDVEWPAMLFDLQFRAGSQIYYRAAKSILPSGISDEQYRPGFNILANVSLTLWKTLSFSLTLQAIEDAVVGDVALQTPVDLFIIQVTGKGGTKGPTFALAKNVQALSMSFSGGVCFFGHYCGGIDVDCSRSEKEKLNVSGTITVSDKLFRNLLPNVTTLRFSYNSDDGISITGWPTFDFAHSSIDFAKEIKNWVNSARGGICSNISGFMNEKLLRTTFFLSPSFSPESNGNTLYLCLNGHYTLHMLDAEILKLDLPSVINVPLPENVSWQALPDIIGHTLAGAAASLLDGIVNNSENLSKILVALAGKEALEVAATLACRNLIDEVIYGAIRAAVTALIEEYGGEFVAGALSALFALIASHTKDHPKPEPKPDPLVPPDAPQYLLAGTRVNADDQPEILFSWSPAALASKYQAALYDAQNHLLAERETSDRFCQVAFRRNKSGDSTDKYVLKVRAAGNGKYSPYALCELNTLPVPALAATWQEAKGLLLTWSIPAGKAEAFELKICAENRESKLRITGSDAIFDPDLPENGDSHYRFSVRALSSLPNLSSTFGAEIHRTRIPRCTLTDLSLQGESARVSWQAPPKASHSDIQLRSRNGGKQWSVNVAAPEQTHVFPLAMEEGSGFFFARVSGRVADAFGDLPALWSEERRVFRPLISLARIARNRGCSAVECGQFLCHDRPAAKLPAIVRCLADAEYPVKEITPALRRIFAAATLMETARGLFHASYPREEADSGLSVAWTETSRTDMLAVLDTVYGPALSLEQAAAMFYAQGLNGADCGKQLIIHYPNTRSIALAKAMAKAGYVAPETSAGVVCACPDIPLKALSVVLQAAYGAPDTLEVLARKTFQEGMNGADCGKRLIACYPHAGSVELAKAMASAGYEVQETLAGLVGARPNLSLKDLAQAARAAYAK
ncbi:hypothetical protein KD288_004221 [Salmonella enterica]|nr:hypothetical protein [Salmonella enterica]